MLVPLDSTPAQERLLRSYCGASRFAYNWTVAIAKANLDKRDEERRAGIHEGDLTFLPWTEWSMITRWNSVKEEVAPWHRDVRARLGSPGYGRRPALQRGGQRRDRAEELQRFEEGFAKWPTRWIPKVQESPLEAVLDVDRIQSTRQLVL